MAQTTYTAQAKLTTQAQRERATDMLCSMLQHAKVLGIWMLDYNVDVPTGTITVVMSNPLPANQLDHLGIDAA